MTDNCCESSADAWRYTRIVIAENAIVAGTAVNGYDDQGGMIVSKSEVNIAEPQDILHWKLKPERQSISCWENQNRFSL
jgi:hypothetical protein